jgi:hypothetical protein
LPLFTALNMKRGFFLKRFNERIFMIIDGVEYVIKETVDDLPY